MWNADWRPDTPVTGGRTADFRQVGQHRESCPCLSLTISRSRQSLQKK